MASVTGLFSFFGWSFLPDFVSGHVQNFWYGLVVRAGEPRPQPGSFRFARDRRIIKGLVIVAYLLFTLYEAHWEILRTGDFYSILGVPHDVDEKTIQSRFRRLTLLHHPDKISNPEARPAAERIYIYLKLARDTLVDSAKRFAYDRNGEGITEWKDCITIHEFVMASLQRMIPFYVGSSLVIVVLQYLGYFDQDAFWRWLVMASLAMFELRTLTHSSAPSLIPSWLVKLVPKSSLLASQHFRPYLPFQTLQFLHKATFTIFLAFGQLGPLITTPITGPPMGGATEEDSVLKQINRLEQAVAAGAMESQRQTALEVVPFQDSQPHLQSLKEQLREWLISNTIRGDKNVQAAVVKVVQRRQQQAEAAGLASAPGTEHITDG